MGNKAFNDIENYIRDFRSKIDKLRHKLIRPHLAKASWIPRQCRQHHQRLATRIYSIFAPEDLLDRLRNRLCPGRNHTCKHFPTERLVLRPIPKVSSSEGESCSNGIVVQRTTRRHDGSELLIEQIGSPSRRTFRGNQYEKFTVGLSRLIPRGRAKQFELRLSPLRRHQTSKNCCQPCS